MVLNPDESPGVGRILDVGDFDAVELDGDFVADAGDFVSVPAVSFKSRFDLRFGKEGL